MNQQLMTDSLGRSPQIKTTTVSVRTSSITSDHRAAEMALQAHQSRGKSTNLIDSCAH